MKETFGTCVKEKMQAKGWTVSELSAKTGLSYLTIKKIVDGETLTPNTKTIHKIAKALGMSANEAISLIYGE